MTKKKDCEPIKDDRVKLGYVPGAPTSIQLIDALGGQPLDLLPVIQAGETDTSIELINETRRIRYYPEEYTRTGGDSGCFYDICIPDIEALMLVNEIGNVESTQPRNGDTLVFNSTTQMYEMVNLDDALGSLGDRITNLSNRVDALEQRVNNLSNSLTEQIARIDNLYNLMTQVNNRIDASSIASVILKVLSTTGLTIRQPRFHAAPSTSLLVVITLTGLSNQELRTRITT